MKTVSKSLITFLAVCLTIFARAQTPIYNSFPSATATIFLDFDGQYVDGTSWNYNGPLTLGASNMTNDQITEIFNRVSEDYRPFNINITTDSTKYWSAPANKRMRVILTVSSSWYGSAGGVSYINSFTWGDNTPCFVFTALLNYKTKYVAEATAHEIGHTLGLNHQSSYDLSCVKTAEYNAGTGSGEIAWAPIMGVGYYRNFTLWHNGSNPYGCSAYQDDLSIIASSSNGFGYRTDDYTNTVSNSTPAVNFVNNQFTVKGIIEQETDVDVFKFTMPTQGVFHVDAAPYSISSGDNGSNLDIQLELLTNSKTVIGTYNPDQILSATIDTTLAAGNYYLRVRGIGNVYAPQYASLGSYTIAAAFNPPTVLPLHRLELKGTNDNNKHRLNWIIEADETVTQQTLEVSTNGRNFQPLATLNSADRSYINSETTGSTVYYRLNVTFDNNKQYFSNTIALPSTAVNKPALKANVITTAATVNSPSAYSYSVLDFNGRTLAKGNLIQGPNSISTFSLSKGMYIIQYSNGQELYAEKFMKQ